MPDETTRRKQFIINAVYTVLVILIAGLLIFSASLIMPFWVALLLAAMMQPLTRLLNSKWNIKKKFASSFVCILFFCMIGGIIAWVITGAVYLVDEALLNLPAFYEDTISPALNSSGDFVSNLLSVIPTQFRPDIDSMQSMLTNGVHTFISGISQKGISFAGNLFSGIPSGFLAIIMTILLAFFINAQYDKVIAFIKCQLPVKVQDCAVEIKQLVKTSVFKYFKSVLILMGITMIELLIGFLIIGVKNPIGLAIGIAVFDALPVFGTGTIMIPWTFFELVNGNYSLAAGLFIVYLIIDVMRNILEPKIIGDQFELNPLVALVTVYAGYQIAGIMGMFLLLIVIYILLAFHKAGKIKLYNSPDKTKKLEVSHGK